MTPVCRKNIFMNIEKEITADSEAYQQSLALIQRCRTPAGFVASPIDVDNYARVWARDGVITGLAALASGEKDLIKAFDDTLSTIAMNQGKHGEIPSNVSVDGKDVSYGHLAGRVDAALWYVIGVCALLNHTKRSSQKIRFLLSVERALYLAECWEYNDRGFIYTPISGNWADEYVQQGYVLSDLLLYEMALRSAGQVFTNKEWQKEALVLRRMLEVNYWPRETLVEDTLVYHSLAYREQVKRGEPQHWLPAFSPAGYVSYFDGMAHALALITNLGNTEQQQQAAAYVYDLEAQVGSSLLPAFWPVIKPGDPQWAALEANHLYEQIKNQPYLYHNGGLWSMLTGLYAAGLAQHQQKERAMQLLSAIDAANRWGREGREWEFAEYHHGQTYAPMGTHYQAWSAASAIIAYQAIWHDIVPWPLCV
jgi:Alkaline and neutral invertase